MWLLMLQKDRNLESGRKFGLWVFFFLLIISLSYEFFDNWPNFHSNKIIENVINPQSMQNQEQIWIDGNDALASFCAEFSGNGTESNPFIIEGITIDFNYNLHGFYGILMAGITITNTNAFLIIRNCNFQQQYDGQYELARGIFLYNCTHVTVDQNYIKGGSCGISVWLSNNCTISDNYCSGSLGENGIDIHSSRNITIKHNTCSNNNQYGINLSNVNNSNIIQNICFGNWDGIYLSSSNNNTISSNDCYLHSWGGLGNGIVLEASKFNLLAGNNCSENVRGIILINKSDNNTVIKNLCNFNFAGIYGSNSNYTTFFENNCSLNYYGIYLFSSYNSTITENNCNLNGYDGIILRVSSYNVLSQNNCLFNNRSGIILSSFDYENWPTEENTITENFCSNNKANGIEITNSCNNSIYSNIFSFNENGISLIESSDYNQISRNNCSANSDSGITVANSSHNVIWGNNFLNNSFFQAQVLGNSSGNLWDNGSIGNYWGDYTEQNPNAQSKNDYSWKTPYSIGPDQDNFPLIDPYPTGEYNIVGGLGGIPDKYYDEEGIVGQAGTGSIYYSTDVFGFLEVDIQGDTADLAFKTPENQTVYNYTVNRL